MSNYFYQAYRLSIISEIQIDAFQEVEKFPPNENILTIQQSDVDFQGHHFKDDFVIREHTTKGFLYVLKNIVAFLITDKRITIYPMLNNSKVWQSFLIGGAMSVVLLNRNYFLLHGSAIEKNDAAYLFLGESGTGKSSIVAALSKLNCSIITDDLCVLSEKGNQTQIGSGTRQVRLLKETVEALELDSITAIKHPNVQLKYAYNYENIPKKNSKVKCIVELAVDSSIQPNVKLEKVTSFERIALLKRNIYKEKLSSIVKGNQFGFKVIMNVINDVEYYRLIRKSVNYPLDEMADFLDIELLKNTGKSLK